MIRSDISVRFADQIEVIYGPGVDPVRPGRDQRGHQHQDPQPRRRHRRGSWAAMGWTTRRNGTPRSASTFFKQSDLPISVTGYVAGRDADLTNFRDDYPAWWQKYDNYLGPIGRAGPPDARRLRPQRVRAAGVQAHLAAGLVPGERAQQLGGQRRGRPQPGAVLRARGALARPVAGGRGPARPVLLGLGHPALDPDLQPLRGRSRVALRVSQRDGRAVPRRLQIRHRHQRFAGGEAGRPAGQPGPPDGRRGGHQLRHHPQDHRAEAGPTREGRRSPRPGASPTTAWPTIRRRSVEINRTVNLQYQQARGLRRGRLQLQRAPAGHRRRPGRRQHPLRRGAHQPARRPHRAGSGRPADAEIHLLDGLRRAGALLLLQHLRQRRADHDPPTRTSTRSGRAPTRSTSPGSPSTCCSAPAATTTRSPIC